MDYGLVLPTQGPLAVPDAVMAVAQRAETTGFTSVWVTDHVAIPYRLASRYPYSGDGAPPWAPEIPYLDALTVLGWVGGATRRVRLGTSILVLPMRPPLLAAKAVGTLDYLTGGRVILAVGAGWLAEEFDLLGQPFRGRGRRTIEAIRILKACWSADPVRFEGEHYRLPAFGMDPKPAQGGRLPILGGGEGDAALRRVAEACDGWHPLGLGPDQVGEGVARLREHAARMGRSFSDLLLTARPGRTLPLTPDLAARYGAHGVRLLVADLDYRSIALDEALRQVDALARRLGL